MCPFVRGVVCSLTPEIVRWTTNCSNPGACAQARQWYQSLLNAKPNQTDASNLHSIIQLTRSMVLWWRLATSL